MEKKQEQLKQAADALVHLMQDVSGGWGTWEGISKCHCRWQTVGVLSHLSVERWLFTVNILFHSLSNRLSSLSRMWTLAAPYPLDVDVQLSLVMLRWTVHLWSCCFCPIKRSEHSSLHRWLDVSCLRQAVGVNGGVWLVAQRCRGGMEKWVQRAAEGESLRHASWYLSSLVSPV